MNDLIDYTQHLYGYKPEQNMFFLSNSSIKVELNNIGLIKISNEAVLKINSTELSNITISSNTDSVELFSLVGESTEIQLLGIIMNKFNILINSSVIGLGIYYPYAAKDILNFDRPTNPDLGAYQLQ